jgi:hypothetical protein
MRGIVLQFVVLFSLISLGGVRLSTLGTSSINCVLYQLHNMMSVQQSVEWELAGVTEILGENLHHCHFVHHKSHMIWSELEPEPPQWEADN